MESTTTELEYRTAAANVDGILADLPLRLAGVVDFDRVMLNSVPRSKQITLWFRRGAKRVFHVKLIRKTGKCLVQVGGMEPTTALRTISVCRDHFDTWFGITPEEKRNT